VKSNGTDCQICLPGYYVSSEVQANGSNKDVCLRGSGACSKRCRLCDGENTCGLTQVHEAEHNSGTPVRGQTNCDWKTDGGYCYQCSKGYMVDITNGHMCVSKPDDLPEEVWDGNCSQGG